MIQIGAKIRTNTGKIYNRRIKKRKEIPAILHIKKNKNRLIRIQRKDILKLEKNVNPRNFFVLQIKLSKENLEKRNVYIQEVQRHPYTGEIIHIDFFEV
ncbi:hypothetical protein [Candidatus Riesia pediculicola]|uniref:hypothetical protein n=1 Tax=Candidatus Riesia pediculicola TaxID=401619 RepID=UPI0009C26436|nr:hypothetical protein [Candidatus Riesia pediculicola]ARC54080.1 hypothetical protein AOE57_00375 [Candidatus Riesia pediculicola]